ncbi:MAG: DNA polymerase III subunit alpha [Spirochaetia bacterium]
MSAEYIHFRSNYSLLRGCRSPEEICRFAKERSLSTVGMTDINNFYGLILFLLAADREGIKPVAGVVVEKKGRELFTAYVMDRRGYGNICRLLTDNLTDAEGTFDPVGALVERGWEGLSVLSPHSDVIDRLALRESDGLYVQLTYGCPFASLVRFARDRGLPAAAIHETVFLDEADESLYPLLRAMDLNTTLERVPEAEKLGGRHRFVEPGAVERLFSAVPEALANTERIAREADVSGIINPQRVFPAFDGLSEEETFRVLSRLCDEGVLRRYGGIRPDIRERLDYELAVIREKGFASYFLVVRDIVQQCPRTCGRGSAASSIVSYLLGITHVDPLRHTLFFERFLNRGRKDPPDIDVDFPWDEREKTLRYVFQKYEGRAAMVANHVTFGPRSALREPAKALGLPEEELRSFVRAFRQGRLDDIPPSVREAAARIRGFPRNLGTHCGGVVITPGPITDYTHVQTSALGYPLIAWEKDATEDAGLVKIDLLGNRSLAVLRDALEMVERNHGRRYEWETFDPLADADTRDLISEGKTIGVFYVESPATRQLLTKMRRGDYENLVIASSIIRPAANQYIRTFVKRLHGAPYRPLHPLIEGTLAETFGVMVYQEDVSRVAIDLAGFPIEEADRLRKILSKKDRDLTLRDLREKFFHGARSRGVADQTIAKVWDMILSFDGYSFCKAHSASYAQVSYRVAYLKRFYPLEFIAAVINNGGGFYGRQTYLDECRRLGFAILPPDVNASGWEYTALPAGLRVGLMQLKDARPELVEAIVQERRRGGPYAGFRDFLLRVPCRFEDVRVLIRSGALDSISEGCSRPQMFFRWQNIDKEEGLGFPPAPPPFIGDYPERVKLKDEVSTLGIVISCHPLKLFRPRIQGIIESLGLSPLVRSIDIPSHRGEKVWAAGILVTGKEVATKKQEPMIFVSFEDELAIFETVLFPGSFAKFHQQLDDGWAFLVYGRVEDDLGALSISVEKLLTVSRKNGEENDAEGEGAGLVAPERPPVFLWSREHAPLGGASVPAGASAQAGASASASTSAQAGASASASTSAQAGASASAGASISAGGSISAGATVDVAFRP